jgi:hypothetical protein
VEGLYDDSLPSSFGYLFDLSPPSLSFLLSDLFRLPTAPLDCRACPGLHLASFSCMASWALAGRLLTTKSCGLAACKPGETGVKGSEADSEMLRAGKWGGCGEEFYWRGEWVCFVWSLEGWVG